MNNTGHQEIKCTAEDCKFNDHVSNCSLSNITVGGTSNDVSRNMQHDCVSYECCNTASN